MTDHSLPANPPQGTMIFKLFLNSTGLFAASFIAVKFSIAIYKVIVALAFNISPGISGYRLFGLNPPDSPVWHRLSILAYFSGDIIIPAFLFILSVMLRHNFRDGRSIWIIALTWLGFNSLSSLFGGISAGIISNTNQYFFLGWLYVPHFIMMLTAILMIPLLIGSGIFYNTVFLRVKPEKGFENGTSRNRKILIYSVFLPVVTGLPFLSLTFLFNIDLYGFIELASPLVMAIAVFLYIKLDEPGLKSEEYSERIYYLPMISAGAGIILFMISNIIIKTASI